MADIEKVINHFEDALSKIKPVDWWVFVRKDFLSDALTLLKEQVKTEVVFKEYDGIFESECGNCGQHLDKAYSNCPKCHKVLDWNKNQS